MPDLSRDVDYRDVEILMSSAAYWPTKADKQALAREQAATGAISAKSEFERLTGWHPFFTSATAPLQTRIFDWTGNPVIQLGAGVADISSVSVQINGQAAPANSFRLLPENSPLDGRPYYCLAWRPHFVQVWRPRLARASYPVTVSVTARWGYCTEYPGDVWQNILQAAGLITLVQIENIQSIASLSQSGFSKAWDVVGIITQKDTADLWKKAFPQCIERYRRVIV